MTLDLYREPSSPRCTIGRLAIMGIFQCWTLEDIVREGPKVAGVTAIPAGRYELALTYSPAFKRTLPLLKNVPGFEGVRIHAGNTAADTRGCILVGQSRHVDAIYASRIALEVLVQKLADDAARGRALELVIHPAVPKGTFTV